MRIEVYDDMVLGDCPADVRNVDLLRKLICFAKRKAITAYYNATYECDTKEYSSDEMIMDCADALREAIETDNLEAMFDAMSSLEVFCEEDPNYYMGDFKQCQDTVKVFCIAMIEEWESIHNLGEIKIKCKKQCCRNCYHLEDDDEEERLFDELY